MTSSWRQKHLLCKSITDEKKLSSRYKNPLLMLLKRFFAKRTKHWTPSSLKYRTRSLLLDSVSPVGTTKVPTDCSCNSNCHISYKKPPPQNYSIQPWTYNRRTTAFNRGHTTAEAFNRGHTTAQIHTDSCTPELQHSTVDIDRGHKTAQIHTGVAELQHSTVDIQYCSDSY